MSFAQAQTKASSPVFSRLEHGASADNDNDSTYDSAKIVVFVNVDAIVTVFVNVVDADAPLSFNAWCAW